MSECKYQFQDKDKFEGQPYCTFFDEQYSELDFICDTNCQVFEFQKTIKTLQAQYNAVVEQNKSLQKELTAYKDVFHKVENLLNLAENAKNADNYFFAVDDAHNLVMEFKHSSI